MGAAVLAAALGLASWLAWLGGPFRPAPAPGYNSAPAPGYDSPAPGYDSTAPGYDSTVLADNPVAFWASGGSGVDRSGRGHTGTFIGGMPGLTRMPNGEAASHFDGLGQYMTSPSAPEFSVSTTKALTWEVWIRPDVLRFPLSTNNYVDFLGKCRSYAPSCEWEGRLYNAEGDPDRASRISAYVFNPQAGLGSGADWQPAPDVLQVEQWIHVVAEYETMTTPEGCSPAYPGSINIWVNGVPQDFAQHSPTGCMSQYRIHPRPTGSPVTVGTMAGDAYFMGAVGKVAIYDHLLSQARITEHYRAMTGQAPSGSCFETCTLSAR